MIESSISTSTALFLSFTPALAAVLCVFAMRKPDMPKALFFSLLVMNSAQSIGYMVNATTGWAVQFFAEVYLISLYFFFASVLIYTIRLRDTESRFDPNWILFPATFVGIAHALGFVTDGFRESQYTLMHYDGLLSPLADLYQLTCMVAIAWVIRENIKRGTVTHLMRSKNVIYAFSFLFPAAVLGIIVLLSFTPFAWSIAFASPAVTIWAAATILYLSKPSIIEVTRGRAWLQSRLDMTKLVFLAGENGTPFPELNDKIQQRAVLEAIEVTDTIPEAVDYSGHSRATLYRWIKRLKADGMLPEDSD